MREQTPSVNFYVEDIGIACACGKHSGAMNADGRYWLDPDTAMTVRCEHCGATYEVTMTLAATPPAATPEPT